MVKHQKSVTTIFFGFGWLVSTPAASQQHKKIFFLATSTLLQVPVPVPVLKIQVPVQVPVLCMQAQVPVPVPKNVLKYNLSTSTSTKYNKTAVCNVRAPYSDD